MIFILSISAVSAGIADNDNSLILNDNVNDLGEKLENAGGDSLLEDSENLDVDRFLEGSENLDVDNLENSLNDFSISDDANSNFIDSDFIDSDSFCSDFIDSNLLNSIGSDSISNDGDSNDGNDVDECDDEDENVTLNTTLTIISKNNWRIYGKSDYNVKLLDENNAPVAGALIKFKIKTPQGKYINEISYTDLKGMAIITLNFNLKGNYNIQVSYDGDDYYNPAKTVNSNVGFYIKTSIKVPVKYAYRSSDFTLKLVSSKGELLSKKKVTIYIDGVKSTKTTDSKGQVYVKMPSNKKRVKLNCSFASADYYESSSFSMDLPVYKKTYTKALVFAILKGKNFKILLKGEDGKILKKEKVKFTINGKDYIRTTSKKGIAYLKVKLKRNEYVVKYSYDNNGVYGPSHNSSTLNVIDPKGQFKKGLNQNTKRSVKKYRSGGGRAHITKAIRKLSKKITSKYSTKLEKATAIFNYVRNNLAYSYYANSRKGAARTLKTKSGNCCDHANLIVALCRASKIPARYSHAQGCRFKISGSIEGHVWAQIYVGGRWYSADGTSYGNSLGHINNWDTRHYYRFRSYRSIPF